MTQVQLNRLLTLERSVSQSDGAGGFSVVWEAIGRQWAQILPGAGRQAAGEEVKLASVPYRITVRGAPVGSPRRPAPGNRLTAPGRVFLIVAVTEQDAGGHYLTCFAREETPT